jgi:hypothetical protein
MKIYHQSNELVILEKKIDIPTLKDRMDVGGVDDLEYFRSKLNRALLNDADEVWAYNPRNRSFEPIKNRRESGTILMSFLVSKGIHIRPDSAQMITLPLRFRFVDDKDHFLFELKF